MTTLAAVNASPSLRRDALTHSGDDADVLKLLQALVAGQKQIIELLRHQRPLSALSRADRDTLERLLPALAGARGSEEFTSRDLAASSATGLRLVLRDLSVKQIGRLLSRAEGVPIGGFVVERCGVEINVALWRVVATVSHRLESGTGISRSCSIGVGEP